MNRRAVTYGLLALLLLGAPRLFAQDYEERRQALLQQQENAREEIQRLNRQIERYRRQIDEASQSIDSLSSRIENLNRLIALQEDKVGQMEAEQNSIREEIAITTRAIDRREGELRSLMERYRNTITYLYKHGRTTELALLFSSESFNQMMRRAYYLGRFDEYVQEQMGQVREAQERLQRTRENLLAAQERNRELLAEIQEEKQRLDDRREGLEEDREALRQDLERYREEVAESQANRDNLDSQLTDINNSLVSLETGGGETVDEATGERVTLAGSYMDDATLSRMEESFSDSKGSLRWPVESGTVSEHFGRRRHPVYGTVTNNMGIEIVTDPGETVRAVHDGYVIAIRPIPGYGDVVMVKHGRYITAYGNLSEINVRQRALLRSGDIIGKAGQSDSPRGESLFFLVRDRNTDLDPEAWLQQK
ncbi:MAG: peptidoglycan DD-metalloendopeptidase family protein [Balneolaceae bacterium]|nr:peptidoglycan DD-metalloendopeptidase family protein [Balneolaceae bacterium]